MLNAQKQRQDRYILPAYPILATGLATAPIWTFGLAAYPLWEIASETLRLYTASEPMPSERNYAHNVHTIATNYPTPHEAYWPISHNLQPWLLDETLTKIEALQGKEGTVGFLLEEQGGAPGYGIILSKAVQMGLRWHIATVMIARPNGPGPKDPNRPLASIFVGPFIFGEWPSREFDVLLTMVSHQDPQQEKWLAQQDMSIVEKWALPMGREGRIYVRKNRLSTPVLE